MIRKEHKNGLKHCAGCDSWVAPINFHANARTWDRLNAYCKVCASRLGAERFQRDRTRLLANTAAYRRNNPEKRKSIALMFKFGIDLAEYRKIEEMQQYRCGICRKPGELHVDHCHESGRVRGLLCMSCNTALGKLGDTPDSIRRVLSYLDLGS